MTTISATPTAVQAAGAEKFVDALGVNTHIDFQAYGYQDLPAVEAAIKYLGLINLRDDPENPADVGANGWWQQVATATGAKFDAFMAEGSVAQMQSDLPRAVQLAQQGIVNFIEGGNEEDDPYAASNGNSLAAAAAFQSSVYAAAHSLGLPAINMSFGQGWTAANNWAGDYDKVGNLVRRRRLRQRPYLPERHAAERDPASDEGRQHRRARPTGDPDRIRLRHQPD